MHGHEDWDFWLNLAEAGYWGYTIPEHLTWYRIAKRSRNWETAGDDMRQQAFHGWLLKKHGQFTQPDSRIQCSLPETEQAYPAVSVESPISNPLDKPTGTRRILFLVTGGMLREQTSSI